MPYKRHRPVPVSEMESGTYQGYGTVCEILREIYRLTDDDAIKMKCRIGISMVRAMTSRLIEYEKFFPSKV